VSLTDPQATWVNRPGVDPFFAYDANYLIDNKAGIILDAAGTRANRAVEIAASQTMIDRVEHRFDPRPRRLAGIPTKVQGGLKVMGGKRQRITGCQLRGTRYWPRICREVWPKKKIAWCAWCKRQQKIERSEEKKD
jgi:hypothetical protein